MTAVTGLSGLSGLGLASVWLPSQISGFVAEFNVARSLATGNLWQNTAKTVAATALNDPVRVLRCPLSGVEWTAPSDAARGLLKISGAYSWIELDGSDDYYDTPTGFAAKPHAFFGAFRPTSASIERALYAGVTAMSGSQKLKIINGSSRLQGGKDGVYNWTQSSTATTLNADQSVGLMYGSTGSAVYYRGNSTDGTADADVSNDSFNNIRRLFANGDPGEYFAGRCYGMYFGTQTLTVSEIALLNTYLQSLYA